MVERYFEKFPVITYGNNQVVDITKRVVISNNTLDNPAAYQVYDLSHEERADQLANRYYDDPYYSWLLYMGNNITDPYHEWYLTTDQFGSLLEKKYGSVEYAQSKIKHYRTNWVGENPITISEYDALADNLKKFWEPQLSMNGSIMNYARRKDDIIISTNSIRAYEIDNMTNKSFKRDEIVDIHFSNNYIGKGQVCFANSTMVHLQHVSGYTLPEPTKTVTVGQSFFSTITNREFVINLYLFAYTRQPNEKEIQRWVDAIDNGMSKTDILYQVLISDEYNTIYSDKDAFVTSLYDKLLNKAPDGYGLDYWVNQLTFGTSETDVAISLFNSTEYNDTYPDNTSFITSLYHKILDSVPSSNDLIYWVDMLDNEIRTRNEIIKDFISSNEYITNQTTLWRLINADIDSYSYVDSIFQFIYEREPTSDELTYWRTMIDNASPISREYVVTSFITSPEFKALQTPIPFDEKLYQIMPDNSVDNTQFVVMLNKIAYGNTISNTNLSYWTNEIDNGALRINVAYEFLTSNSYMDLHSGSLNYITAIFNDILERDPKLDELTYYTNYFATNFEHIPQSQIAHDIITSDEFNNLQKKPTTITPRIVSNVHITFNSYLYGHESQTNVVFYNAFSYANNILLEEGVYYEPVTYYTYEYEKNEGNKSIEVIQSKYAENIATQLKDLLK